MEIYCLLSEINNTIIQKSLLFIMHELHNCLVEMLSLK